MKEEIIAFVKRFKISKRFVSFIKRYEWSILIISTVLCWILGFIGFYLYYQENGIFVSFTGIAYLTFQLFTFSSGFVDGHVPVVLDIARFLAPLTLVYAAIIAFMWFVNLQYKKFKLKWYKSHTIFLGIGKLGTQLLKDLQNSGQKIVIVTKEEIPPSDRYSDAKTIFITGNANNKKILKQIRIDHAKHVMCMMDDEYENLSNGFKAGEYIDETKPKDKGKIFVQVSPLLIEQLQELDFDDKASENHQIFWDNIHFFNIYERAARMLIHEYAPDKFACFDNNSKAQAHILIAGFGALGQAILLQAGKMYHFANRNKLKATILFSDNEELERFKETYQGINKVIDLNFIEQKKVNERNIKEQSGNTDIQVIFVCVEDDLVAFDAYNKMNQLIPKSHLIICHEKADSFLKRIERNNVHHFKINDETLKMHSIVKDDIDTQAMKVHSMYQFKELKIDEKLKELKKLTHQDWEKLTERTKNQNRNQADHIMIKLRAAGCITVPFEENEALYDFTSDMELVELLAEVEHRRWNVEQLLSGWIYGKERNNALKIHDNIVPYKKLSELIKDYDRDAVINIPLILASVGLQVKKV